MVSFNAHRCRGRVDDVGFVLIHQAKDRGDSISKIARDLHVARSTVRRWLDRPKAPSKQAKRASGVGKRVRRQIAARRKAVLRLARETESFERESFTPVRGIRRTRTFTRLKYPSSTDIAMALNRLTDFNVTATTVRRDLRASGFRAYKRSAAPRLTAEHKAERLEKCKQFQEDPLVMLQTIFCDESNSDTNEKYRCFQWSDDPSTVEPLVIDQAPTKVMVLGFIGVGYKKLLRVPTVNRRNRHGNVVRSCSVTKEIYEQMLLEVVPDLQKARYFMQDNAAAHTAVFNSGFFERRGIDVLDWPAKSPDLNPIETMWAIVGRAVERMGPYGHDELWTFVKRAWDDVPQETVDRLVLEFDARVQCCINKGGDVVKRVDVRREMKRREKRAR